MDDFTLDIMIGEGPAARTVKIDLPKFTLIGATTRIGLLSNPLRDRFGIPLKLDFYSPSELLHVLSRAAKLLNTSYTEAGLQQIANRARGTPRIALRLLRRVRDFVLLSSDDCLDVNIAEYALEKLGVDNLGLDQSDRRYIEFIANNYGGGPVGIETISAGLSEQSDNVEETIEPYLIKIGFLQRTPRGRVVTKLAMDHVVSGFNLK
jgi:Holliday junction DNA helicase RuvB